MDISQAELNEKVRLHQLWLADNRNGVRLILSEIDLCGAELRYANLSHADLRKVNLSGSDLTNADLCATNLHGANLTNANLLVANLYRADLYESNLTSANLSRANLQEARLQVANLTNANLQLSLLTCTMLGRATLSGTCLDPDNKPNGNVDGFEQVNDYVIGYRTKRSIFVSRNVYEPGQRYEAPVFSTCLVTECHPGLYLCPTTTTVRRQIGYSHTPIVKVRTKPDAVHYAGNKGRCKWRCKWFEVLEEV